MAKEEFIEQPGIGASWKSFWATLAALYGPAGCHISVLAAHDYDCNPTSTLEYLRFLHQRYELPIWLTEFSCGDGKEDSPMSAQLSFMSLIFPLLEAAPYVERYRCVRGGRQAGGGSLPPLSLSHPPPAIPPTAG